MNTLGKSLQITTHCTPLVCQALKEFLYMLPFIACCLLRARATWWYRGRNAGWDWQGPQSRSVWAGTRTLVQSDEKAVELTVILQRGEQGRRKLVLVGHCPALHSHLSYTWKYGWAFPQEKKEAGGHRGAKFTDTRWDAPSDHAGEFWGHGALGMGCAKPSGHATQAPHCSPVSLTAFQACHWYVGRRSWGDLEKMANSSDFSSNLSQAMTLILKYLDAAMMVNRKRASQPEHDYKLSRLHIILHAGFSVGQEKKFRRKFCERHFK